LNKIAHTPEIAEIQKKMAILKDKYFACLTQKQVDGLKNQPDDFIAMSACSTCAGFIATLESRILGLLHLSPLGESAATTMAEGEELGSNLLHAVQRTLTVPIIYGMPVRQGENSL
jgi:hypothetical protein